MRLLKHFSEHDINEYERKTGVVKLSKLLLELNKKVENLKPAVGTLILPVNKEIKLQDIVITNFTKTGLELVFKLGKTERNRYRRCILAM